jgi:release factor glutamine methyltransferase
VVGLLVNEKVVLTIGEILGWATALLSSAGVENARLEAECLLASLLGRDRLSLYAAAPERLPPLLLDPYRALVSRRRTREPLAYLTGTKEFWSLSLKVTPGVLIPRPETEVLVEAALARLEGLQAPVVAEVGTGSGAIAVAIAKTLPRARITATEVSSEALAVARENAGAHGVLPRISFLQGDLLEPLFDRNLAGPFDLIVSNPPYVATGELAALPSEVRYEPVEALDGGPDGLRCHRRIIEGAPRLLRLGGWLALEMAPWQGDRLTSLLRDGGAFAEVAVIADLGRRPRVVVACSTGVGPRTHGPLGAIPRHGSASEMDGA